MRNNDRLLYEIGELDDVPAIVKEKKKVSRVTWALLGSAAAAAAVAGFVILRGTGTAKSPWEDYRIYSPADYSKEIIIDEPPKIPYQLENIIIYWDEPYEARAYLHTASDIENSSAGNPWNEETELTSLPIFKNRSPDTWAGFIPAGIRCLTEEQLTQMLDNTVRALGVTVQNSGFDYVDWGTDENAELPIWLSAECSGEEYGADMIDITVYADSDILISFPYSLKLPDEYMIADPDNEQKEKIVSYLADRFKNLLQFEDPVLTAENDKYSGYTVYNGSENIAESIVNYNLANASFQLYEEGLYSIQLRNLLCISDYIGDYPVISFEKARELLLSGSYLKRFPDSFLKGGAINEEDIAKAELIYFNYSDEEYFKPYYHFYVEVDSSSIEDYYGESLTLYGDVYVPAVEARYILNDSINPLYLPDFSGNVPEAYPAEDIELPDGSSVSKTEAVRSYGNEEEPYLEFNFGFLRYAKPIFQSTLDDPDCFDYDSYEFAEPADAIISEPDYFKVRAGDVLENGMTVESANYKVTWKDGKQSFVESEVVLNGKMTCEGILLCRQRSVIGDVRSDDDLIYDLVFYADPTGDTPVPVFCSMGDGTERLETVILDETAFMLDGKEISLSRNTDKSTAEAEGYSEIIDGSRGIRAKMTFYRLSYSVIGENGYISAGPPALYQEMEILE